MCTGTAMLYKIPRIVVGENVNYKSLAEKWLEEAKVQVHLEQNKECIQMMETFIKTKPELWNEDIHEIWSNVFKFSKYAGLMKDKYYSSTI